jgi:DNA-binding beta-propeller fold protein YncE
MLRAFTLAGALLAASATLVAASPSATKPFPQVIQLPQGFQPEGIEVGKGTTFYVGSRVTGAVYRGNLRTGAGAILIPGGSGRTATGIELDSQNRLWVAGAGTGDGYVFNAKSGSLIRTYDFASGDTFVNDVVVTKNAAYFTDSRKALLYKVPIGPGGALGAFTTVTLGSPFVLGAGFNLNGIDATRNGETLIAVQSNNGKLFRINAASGAVREITLAGGESVPNGDGILLTGKTLYVVQNTDNRVAVIALAPNFASGRVATRLSDPDFRVPTTIDDHGRRLYAVNAKFGVASPGTAPYEVVQLAKPKGPR